MVALVTDRTQADVNRLTELTRKALTGTGATFADRLTEAEQAEWLALNNKGAYNASDLNRVSAACNQLYDYMTGIGYVVPGYVRQTTAWSAQDVPTEETMSCYLANIAALKDVFHASEQLPPGMNGLNVLEANRIERLILEIENLMTLVQMSYIYSGELQSGEQ